MLRCRPCKRVLVFLCLFPRVLGGLARMIRKGPNGHQKVSSAQQKLAAVNPLGGAWPSLPPLSVSVAGTMLGLPTIALALTIVATAVQVVTDRKTVKHNRFSFDTSERWPTDVPLTTVCNGRRHRIDRPVSLTPDSRRQIRQCLLG